MSSFYLDHAATSFPKDPRVVEAVRDALATAGAPDRGAHAAARRAGRWLEEARRLAARLLGVAAPERVVFTLNATDALNAALKGLLRAGDEVVTTAIEHNSVMRPLEGLRRRLGIQWKAAPAEPDGSVAAASILERVRDATRLVVLVHASNVTGALLPVAEVGAALKRRPRRPLLVVDAAQTSGYRPLEEVAAVADAIAFAGHKGPGGPQGTGGLWVREGVEILPWREGGTGSRSEEILQPDTFPTFLEAGSPNLPGIAGLAEAARIRLEEDGLEQVAAARRAAVEAFLEGTRGMAGVEVLGPGRQREPVFPVRVAGFTPAEAAVILEERCGILARSGLHCAPGAHRALGTFPDGTLRLSFGAHVTVADVDRAVRALAELAAAG